MYFLFISPRIIDLDFFYYYYFLKELAYVNESACLFLRSIDQTVKETGAFSHSNTDIMS